MEIVASHPLVSYEDNLGEFIIASLESQVVVGWKNRSTDTLLIPLDQIQLVQGSTGSIQLNAHHYSFVFSNTTVQDLLQWLSLNLAKCQLDLLPVSGQQETYQAVKSVPNSVMFF